ncbi:MAG: shikimate dehydrogenase [Thermoleophilia bacterium]
MTGKTSLVGIFGDPVAHSLSPQMHNAAYEAMGLDLCYVPMHVSKEGLAAAVAGIKVMGFLGVNLTIPHKVAVVPLLDRLDTAAATIGAVNTVVNDNGSLVGYNTDGVGFIMALEEETPIEYAGTEALVFGAGGAARAISLALAQKGIGAINIVNRSRDSAESLRDMLLASFPQLPVSLNDLEDDYNDLVSTSKLVINATSVGMEGRLKGSSFTVDRLSSDHTVCDVVYSTGETSLLIAANEFRATTMGGLGMLLHQGAEAIRLWSGQEPPLPVMRLAIESERTDIPKEP